MASKNIHTFDSNNRTDLSSALTSQSIALLSFSSPVGKSPLLVYVEDAEDVPFWSELFSRIKERYSEVRVTTLKERAANNMAEVKADGDPLSATGKDALMQVPGLGANKVVAVDRDYDSLVSHYHVYSDRVQNDPYVISTTYYAIENHMAWPGAVNAYLQQILGTENDYTSDYTAQLTQYNDVLNPIIISMLANYEYCKVANMEVAFSVDFLRKKLKRLGKREDVPMYDACKTSLAPLNKLISTNFAREYETILQKLQTCGKYPNELWKVVQGHTLFDFVKGYMYRLVISVYKDTINAIVLRNSADKRRIGPEISALKRTMYGKYKNATTCIDRIMYYNPVIDYSDDGIVKMINKIESIR